MKVPKLKKWQPIVVDWVDSIGYSGWTSEEKMEQEDLEEDIKHQSCGFYFKHTKNTIMIIQSRGLNIDNVNDCIAIPLCSVSKIKKLK